MITIGYQDTYDALPESLREKVSMPRQKIISEIAFLEELDNDILK